MKSTDGHRGALGGWMLGVLCVVHVSPAGWSQEPGDAVTTPPAVLAGHSVHGEAFNEGPRQAAALMPGLGRAKFPITVREQSGQAFFNQGIDQLHGFWYFEAERSFRQVAQIDPECAMAYWGMAMANINNESRAKAFIATAFQKRAQASEREQLYIDALHRYYGDGELKARAEALIVDLEKIICAHPDDLEAKAFLAFQLWKNKDAGIPIGSRVAVDVLLEQVFAVEPLHPAHHYEIHLWDDHRGTMALASAARCGPALPGIAHMWHMPGHTYSELKRYDDAVWQMEASACVDHAYMQRDWVMPDQIHNFAHNNEWLIRNYMHVGRVHAAIAMAQNMISMPRHPKYNTLDKSGTAQRGRQRLFDVLRQFAMWPELIELAQSPFLLESDATSLAEIERRRYLAEAYFRLPDVTAGQALREALQAELAAAKAERETILASHRAEAAGELERKVEELKVRFAAVRELASSHAPLLGAAGAVAGRWPPWERAGLRAAKHKIRQDAPQAEQAVQQPFAARIEALEKAERELNGFAAAAAGDFAQAIALLEPSGAERTLDVAQFRLASGATESALEAVRQYVKSHEQEAVPLAILAEMLWQAGQKDEALATFQQLRGLTGSMDLDAPIFARLAPLAAAAGLPSDWRLTRALPTDIGERPDLESLGPLFWSPPLARDWVLPDADGQSVSLKDFSGRSIVLIFYLGHGCLHCVEQVQKFAEKSSAFAAQGLELVAISTDSIEDLRLSVENYAGAADQLPIQLLSDSQRTVFRAYRAYDDFENQPLHATLVIDSAGRIRWLDIGFEPFQEVDFLLAEAQRLLSIDPPPIATSFD